MLTTRARRDPLGRQAELAIVARADDSRQYRRDQDDEHQQRCENRTGNPKHERCPAYAFPPTPAWVEEYWGSARLTHWFTKGTPYSRR